MEEKINNLKLQIRALKNTSVTNFLALKHNATLAMAMAVDLIEELSEKIAKLEGRD